MLPFRRLNLVLLLVFVLMGSQMLRADDIPNSTESTVWKGPYLGIVLGEAFGNYQTSIDTGTASDSSYFSSADNISAVNQSGVADLGIRSLVLGIRAGNDWTWNSLVFGVVMDYSTFKQESINNASQRAYPSGEGNYQLRTSLRTDWLLTLRARTGFQFQAIWPSLFYVTGGLAITKLNASTTLSDDTSLEGVGLTHFSANQMGWTLGGGVEFALRSYLSMNVEYLYIGVSDIQMSGTISNSSGGFGVPASSVSSPLTTNIGFHSSLVRAGISYRFSDL